MQTGMRILIAALALAGPVAAQQETAPKSTGSQVLDSAGRIVQKPLQDMNVVKEGVPPALEAIMAEPYSLKGLKGCADYAREIGNLTELLGPDVDSPQARAAKGTSTDFLLGTAEAVAGSLIPGTGIIRKVSGASDAQKHAQAAVLAGQLRRAFLKGQSSGRGCRS